MTQVFKIGSNQSRMGGRLLVSRCGSFIKQTKDHWASQRGKKTHCSRKDHVTYPTNHGKRKIDFYDPSPFCASFSHTTCCHLQRGLVSTIPPVGTAANNRPCGCVLYDGQRNTIQESRKWPKLNHLIIVAKILQNTHRKNEISGRLENIHYTCCFPVPNLVPVCIAGLKKYRSWQKMSSTYLTKPMEKTRWQSMTKPPQWIAESSACLHCWFKKASVLTKHVKHIFDQADGKNQMAKQDKAPAMNCRI